MHPAILIHRRGQNPAARLGSCALLAALCALLSIAHASHAFGSATRIVASTVDGQSVHGTLVELSVDGVTTDEPAWRALVKLPAARLASVAPAREHVPPAAPTTILVSVADGSLLAATSFQAHDGVAEVRLTNGRSLSIPTKRIDWVRFHAAGGEDPLADQWTELVAGATGQRSAGTTATDSERTKSGPATADVLVLHKKQELDYLEGVIGRVADDSVVFEVDGEPATVKRSRIEGLIYYRAKKDELADAAAVAMVRGGSRLQVASIALAADDVKLSTPGGVELSLPLDDLDRVDFSSANSQFLSDLEPESFAYVPYFGGKDQPASLAEFYKPRRDVSFDLNPLRLDGKTYSKGLSMHARSTVVYRLPGKFRRLAGVVGIDDAVRDGGDARLEIRGDGKMLWETPLRGTEPAQAMDVPIAGVKRLEILIDFGADFDAGDVVDLGDAKVTR
ncbi:MAG TPA: NPCBM/NEW2 domain-containing protein [Pirellulales bacterium]|nr:NPCBM/NEW2 domain-containing protein [Pirellulales bacterium]